jgi:hypothetical protein
MGRTAEEPLESPPGQLRGRRYVTEKRNLHPLRHHARRLRYLALEGAKEGRHLFLRNQTFGLAQAKVGFALVVGNDDRHFDPFQIRETLTFRKRQVQVPILTGIDDIQRQLHGVLVVQANLSAWAGHGIKGSNFYFPLGTGEGRENPGRNNPKNKIPQQNLFHSKGLLSIYFNAFRFESRCPDGNTGGYVFSIL